MAPELLGIEDDADGRGPLRWKKPMMLQLVVVIIENWNSQRTGLSTKVPIRPNYSLEGVVDGLSRRQNLKVALVEWLGQL